jgi:cysteine desulfurase
MKRIYLDHAATTPLHPQVLEAMRPYLTGEFGNASSVHAYGRQARQALEDARSVLASAIGAESGEVFFTSGGTESDNTALQGVYHRSRKVGRDELITSAAEHHAVLDCLEALQEEGAQVKILPVDGNGALGADSLRESLSERTCLVSVMHANNEVGTITDLEELAEAAHARGALFHTDAVQSFGKVPLDVDSLKVDLLSLSAHKIYGPKGIGALYVRRGTNLQNLLWGGGQERGRRPGTENVASAVGFAAAARLALEDRQTESARLRALRDQLQESLRAAVPGVLVNGDPLRRLPHILNISIDARLTQLQGELLVVNMDLQGIAVSSGSACTSGSIQPSHVLLAMGQDPATARAAVRFSFGRENSASDLDRALEALLESIRLCS